MFTPNKFKDIFTVNKCFYRAIENGHHFRDIKIEAAVKLISCKTSKLGKKTYYCSNQRCPHIKHVFNSCKCKLCPSCGQKATEQWIATQNEILPDCQFRHITMPNQFWDIFKRNRWLLKDLFPLAANTLLSLAKARKLTIGIFSALHTYGRKINFNCHIHLSLAEYGIDKNENLKKFSFKFGLLVGQWRYGIINVLRKHYDNLDLPQELGEEAVAVSHILAAVGNLQAASALPSTDWTTASLKDYNPNKLPRYVKALGKATSINVHTKTALEVLIQKANIDPIVSGIFSTGSAFAALKADGSVVTWGSSAYGGNSASVAKEQ